MRLFTPDLTRNFAIGFAAGALLVSAVSAEWWSDQVSPPARAGEALHTPGPSLDDFVGAAHSPEAQ